MRRIILIIVLLTIAHNSFSGTCGAEMMPLVAADVDIVRKVMLSIELSSKDESYTHKKTAKEVEAHAKKMASQLDILDLYSDDPCRLYIFSLNYNTSQVAKSNRDKVSNVLPQKIKWLNSITAKEVQENWDARNKIKDEFFVEIGTNTKGTTHEFYEVLFDVIKETRVICTFWHDRAKVLDFTKETLMPPKDKVVLLNQTNHKIEKHYCERY